MALEDKKISDLVAATDLASNDLLIVVDTSTHITKKVTLANFKILGGFFAGLQSDLLVDDLTALGLTDTELVGTNSNGIGNALCIDASSGGFVDASAAALATVPCVGLALELGVGVKDLLIQGYIRNDAWTWTPGAPVFLSADPGILTQTPPEGAGLYVQVVGVARTSTILLFKPDYTVIERVS